MKKCWNHLSIFLLTTYIFHAILNSEIKRLEKVWFITFLQCLKKELQVIDLTPFDVRFLLFVQPLGRCCVIFIIFAIW